MDPELFETLDGILGTESVDRLVFDLARDAIEHTDTDAVRLAVETAAGEAAEALIAGVERLELSDGTFPFDLGEGADFTYRLYSAGLGRTPDEAGLRFWDGILDAGARVEMVAEAFLDSIEIPEVLGTDAPSAADYVDAFYENVLGRSGEAGGRDFWTGVLEAPGAEAADVLLEFVNGVENIERQAENY